MQEPPNEGPDDWFFDEQQQRWLRHSGKAHWRRVLDERRRAAATPQAQAEHQAFLDRYNLRLDGTVGLRLFRRSREGRYPGGMSRSDIDLSIETPAFVGQHLDLADRLAGRAADRSADTPEVTDLRATIRQQIRERLAAGRTEQAQAARRAAGQAFLAQYGLQ